MGYNILSSLAFPQNTKNFYAGKYIQLKQIEHLSETNDSITDPIST